MTTRKKKVSVASIGHEIAQKRGTATKRSVSSRADAGSGWDLAMKAIPGAAALATGLAGAAGYVFRKNLLEALKMGTEEATTAAKAVSVLASDARGQAGESVERLLHGMGLERRRPMFLSFAGPAIGAVCGVAAGVALTYFFGPQLFERLGLASAPVNDVDHASEDRVASASSPSTGGEAIYSNGGATSQRHPAS